MRDGGSGGGGGGSAVEYRCDVATEGGNGRTIASASHRYNDFLELSKVAGPAVATAAQGGGGGGGAAAAAAAAATAAAAAANPPALPPFPGKQRFSSIGVGAAMGVAPNPARLEQRRAALELWARALLAWVPRLEVWPDMLGRHPLRSAAAAVRTFLALPAPAS